MKTRFFMFVAIMLMQRLVIAAPVEVDASSITKREDLVGKEIAVDDRLARFQFHPGIGFDEIFLKHAPDVTFSLPPKLRLQQSPQAIAVKVRGVLRHDRGRWWCEVSSFDILPSDLDRLNRGIAVLAKNDIDQRMPWIRWAERRAKDYGDEPLANRARELEAEAIRAESEQQVRDPAAHWLGLAARAREHKIAEPEPSAQAHRGFRAALVDAKSADVLRAIIGKIEAFFPNAKRIPVASPDLTRWDRIYKNAPADGYRAAPADARVVLDHRLWADATQQWLTRRGDDDPKSTLTLADEALTLLPDRPLFTGKLLEKGLAEASSDVGALRQSEVDILAKHYRDSLHQPEKATSLYRDWLDDQRTKRLSQRDAEGRLALADQYEALLKDKATATTLLRDAWAIDPQSREVADAFRRRGFRKVNDNWVEPSRGKSASTVEVAKDDPGGERKTEKEPSEPAPSVIEAPKGRSDSLRNATREEVRSRLGGKPNRRLWIASQGQLLEQWIYYGPRQNQYVNILHKPGDPQPRVSSYYSLPRTPNDPPAGP